MNLKLTGNFDILDQIAQKSITGKMDIAMEFCLFELICVPKFSLNLKFWFFWPILPPPQKKKIALVKNGKCKHHHWIVHIQISLSKKFQLKLAILMFWTKFAQKRYFWSKTEQVSITIDFWIFQCCSST